MYCKHRFSSFINNVNTEKSFWIFQNSSLDSKKHLLSLSPHITIHNHLVRYLKGFHHILPCHRTTFLHVLYCNSILTARKRNLYKLQLSNARLSSSEISLQPLKKKWVSRQNKILQTSHFSHLWHWFVFLLVFREEIFFFLIVSPVESFPYFQL